MKTLRRLNPIKKPKTKNKVRKIDFIEDRAKTISHNVLTQIHERCQEVFYAMIMDTSNERRRNNATIVVTFDPVTNDGDEIHIGCRFSKRQDVADTVIEKLRIEEMITGGEV